MGRTGEALKHYQDVSEYYEGVEAVYPDQIDPYSEMKSNLRSKIQEFKGLS